MILQIGYVDKCGSFRIKLEGPEHGWLNDWCYMILFIYTYYWLVVSIPLKNMKVSWDDDIPNIWKVIKNHVPNHQPNIYICWIQIYFAWKGACTHLFFFYLFAERIILAVSPFPSLGGWNRLFQSTNNEHMNINEQYINIYVYDYMVVHIYNREREGEGERKTKHKYCSIRTRSQRCTM